MDTPLPDAIEGQFPTYKVLLELKGNADGLDFWKGNPGVSCSWTQELLAVWVNKLYPTITIQCPGHFYQTVERLQLPTTGPKALKGDELTQYLA